MAHGWAAGFKKFHPDSKLVISAEGSETVFDRVANNPSSIAMVSRPVSDEDLKRLKESGMKQPVAVLVAREPLGIFVNRKNPIDAVDYRTLVSLACSREGEEKLTWGAAGLKGEFESEPVVIVGRDRESGTRVFLRNYIFRGLQVRDTDKQVDTNYEVVSEIEKNPYAVGISSLRCGRHGAKLLHLKSNGVVIPSDDHSILVGNYPLIQPLCLIFDMGREDEAAIATREFVLYALSQAGQTDAILAGYFPFDPPTLRGQVEKIGFEKTEANQSLSTDPTVKSTSRETKDKVSR
jgi:phosphate transport system substrate-binding protein